MSADFYVYLNAPNNKALIHQADCPHCNHGEGRTSIKSDYNREWIARSIIRQSGQGLGNPARIAFIDAHFAPTDSAFPETMFDQTSPRFVDLPSLKFRMGTKAGKETR